jgi:nitronate monooxygenase
MPEIMTRADLGALLNELLEAERAGARLLSAWMTEAAPGSVLYERLREVQRDEARNCAVLIHHLLDAVALPSGLTGEFYDKGLRVQDWETRLALLNRGQGWVARRIAGALPRLGPSEARDALQEMHDSHLANIARCEALIAPA